MGSVAATANTENCSIRASSSIFVLRKKDLFFNIWGGGNEEIKGCETSIAL